VKLYTRDELLPAEEQTNGRACGRVDFKRARGQEKKTKTPLRFSILGRTSVREGTTAH